MFFLEMKYVGFDNFLRVFKDRLFWKSITNILLYTVMAVPLNVAISLLLASLVNNKIAGAKVYRVLYYLPSVTSAVFTINFFIFLPVSPHISDFFPL